MITEQAVHHALYKREDLPATKYQKPHFQPINIADADFSPSIKTSMPYSSYQKHLEDSAGSDSTVHNFQCSDINHKDTDLIESPVVNNYHKIDTILLDESEGKQISSENVSEIIDEEIDTQIVEQEGEVLDHLNNSSINLDVLPDNSSNSMDNCVEESQNKPDLIENELINEEICEDEISNGSKLPDLTEISQEKSTEIEFDKIGSFDLIRNESETKNGVEDKEVTAEYVSEERSVNYFERALNLKFF